MPKLFFALLLLPGFASTAAVGPETVDDECAVLLLQTNAGLQRQSVVHLAESRSDTAQTTEPLSQADRLQAALPLNYVHIPKTGSSIANAFIRLPGVCPELVEELGDDSFNAGQEDQQFEIFNSRMEELGDDSLCSRGISQGARAFGFHEHLGDDAHFDEHFAGHAVTMLRQPEQRVISGMRHAAHDMEVSLETLQFSGGCAARLIAGDAPDFRESHTYPACFAMNVTNTPLPEVPADDVVTAVERLRQFAFVGIQEEWHLSVCLLHEMFGGECHATEFTNTRPSPSGQDAADLRQGNVEVIFAPPEPYDTSILGGWVDTADRAVYDAGLDMFQANCDEFEVSPESCRPCYEAAGIL